MEVWIVTSENLEFNLVRFRGVFSSKEKAQEYILEVSKYDSAKTKYSIKNAIIDDEL